MEEKSELWNPIFQLCTTSTSWYFVRGFSDRSPWLKEFTNLLSLNICLTSLWYSVYDNRFISKPSIYGSPDLESRTIIQMFSRASFVTEIGSRLKFPFQEMLVTPNSQRASFTVASLNTAQTGAARMHSLRQSTFFPDQSTWADCPTPLICG